MKRTSRKSLLLGVLFMLAGSANAVILSSDARSLSHLAACADGTGGLWLLVGEAAGGWEDDILSVSVWHTSGTNESNRIGGISFSEDGGSKQISIFANCHGSESGATAHVQTGSSLAEFRLTKTAATLRRRIDLEPLKERDAQYATVRFVGMVKGALVIATPSIWLEGDQGLDLVKRDPEVPWVAGLSFFSTGEHLYYVETTTPPEEFAPRGGQETVHAHRIRLVQETPTTTGWVRTGQSAPLDIPGRRPDNENGFPPGHFTMVESGRFHMLSYYIGGDRLILHSGSKTSNWGNNDTEALVRLDLDQRQVVEGFHLGPTVLVPWTKLARSLYFAHVVETGRLQPRTLRVIRAGAGDDTEWMDVPLPPSFQSLMGIFPYGFDIVASGDRLYAISTVSGPFDGERLGNHVVAIDRLR